MPSAAVGAAVRVIVISLCSDSDYNKETTY